VGINSKVKKANIAKSKKKKLRRDENDDEEFEDNWIENCLNAKSTRR
jgi:hypothetical protein